MLFAHLGRTGKTGTTLRKEKGQLAQVRPVGDLRRGRKAPLHVQPGQERLYLQGGAGIELLFHRVLFDMSSHLYGLVTRARQAPDAAHYLQSQQHRRQLGRAASQSGPQGIHVQRALLP